jgi:hypothetical protein
VKNTDLRRVNLSDVLLRKMTEWEAKNRILSAKERGYLADFAYGLKKRTDFHDKNLKHHLTTLVKNGFEL